jgi:hypothetical protein
MERTTRIEPTLRIREHIEAGVLPVMMPEEVRAGYGAGAACVACDLLITSTQVAYEIEDSRPGLRFHLSCYVVWQAACAQTGLGGVDWEVAPASPQIVESVQSD